MKTLCSFVRSPALLAVSGTLLMSRAVHAAGLPTAKGTGQVQGSAVWICLAAFVLGTLGLAFWNSKRRETE